MPHDADRTGLLGVGASRARCRARRTSVVVRLATKRLLSIWTTRQHQTDNLQRCCCCCCYCKGEARMNSQWFINNKRLSTERDCNLASIGDAAEASAALRLVASPASHCSLLPFSFSPHHYLHLGRALAAAVVRAWHYVTMLALRESLVRTMCLSSFNVFCNTGKFSQP